jgi:hypothetical protein
MEERPTLVFEAREDDVKEQDEEHGDTSSLDNGTRENGGWLDDNASTGTAFREELNKFESEGEWAQNLFYAYARRVCSL